MVFAIAVGLIRGLLTLVLLFFTGRLWLRARKNRKQSKEDG